jgi:hypothetical protein
MRGLKARCVRMVLAATIAVQIGSEASAFDGEDDDLVDEASTVSDQQRGRLNVQDIAANIDRWLYGNNEAVGEEAEQKLDLLLRKRVNQVALSAAITKDQEQKLWFAGKVDIRRFFDRVEELKAKYPPGTLAPNAWNQVFEEIRPLQAAINSGPFGGNSLFAKTMSKMLTADQVAAYRKIERDRRLFQHRAGVNMTVLRLSTALGLSADQQARLKELLLKETRPARMLGQTYPAAFFNVVYAQMGRIPEEKLKPLFEPWQWRALRAKLPNAGNFGAALQERDGDQDDDPLATEPPAPRLGRPARSGKSNRN